MQITELSGHGNNGMGPPRPNTLQLVWKTFQLPSFPEAASRSCKALFSFLDKRSLGLRYVQSLAQMVAKWPLLVEAKGRQSLEV